MPAMLTTDIKPGKSASFPWTASSLWKILGGKKNKNAGLISVTLVWKSHITWQSPKCLHAFCYSFHPPPADPEHWWQNDQANVTHIFRKALLPSSRTLVLNHLSLSALLCYCIPSTLLALSLRYILFLFYLGIHLQKKCKKLHYNWHSRWIISIN